MFWGEEYENVEKLQMEKFQCAEDSAYGHCFVDVLFFGFWTPWHHGYGYLFRVQIDVDSSQMIWEDEQADLGTLFLDEPIFPWRNISCKDWTYHISL